MRNLRSLTICVLPHGGYLRRPNAGEIEADLPRTKLMLARIRVIVLQQEFSPLVVSDNGWGLTLERRLTRRELKVRRPGPAIM